MKKLYLFVLMSFVVILTACSFQSKSDNLLVGADRDEHGCIGSAGYEWCEEYQECIRPWEEECPNLVMEDAVDEDVFEQAVLEEDPSASSGGQEDDFVTEEGNVMSEGVDVDYETDLINRIYSVLDGVKEYSNIEFDDILPVDFYWSVEMDAGLEDLLVEGYGISKVVSNDSVFDVEEYFRNNDWMESLVNMADGTEGGLVGFYEDEIGCVIIWGFTEDSSTDISVSCGSVAVG